MARTDTLLSQLRDLLTRLDADRDAAHDLWTWLPSYKVTQKHHGDYASEHVPTPADVMREASMLIHLLLKPEKTEPSAEAKEWFEGCACGEFEHGEG